jgi:transposase-like protein
MAKKKAKRYSDAKKKEILDFVESQGRGGQSAAVKKFKVSPITINAWKRKAAGDQVGNGLVSKGSSKELKAVQELASILTEMEATEAQLANLKKRYQKLKSNL